VPSGRGAKIIIQRYYWTRKGTPMLHSRVATVLASFVLAVTRFARRHNINVPNEIICCILEQVELGTVLLE